MGDQKHSVKFGLFRGASIYDERKALLMRLVNTSGIRRAAVYGCLAILICLNSGCGTSSEASSTAIHGQRPAGLEVTGLHPVTSRRPSHTGTVRRFPPSTPRPYPGTPRPNGIIARSKASDTKVSASAVLSPPISVPRFPGGGYRNLTVSYRVEYRSGLRPAGVHVLARTSGNPSPVGGSERIGSEGVQTGQMQLPFSLHDTGRVEIEVFAESSFGTPVGVGRTYIAAGQK